MIYSSSYGSGKYRSVRPGELMVQKKAHDEFDYAESGCSGDCNNCPVLDCENNVQNDGKVVEE